MSTDVYFDLDCDTLTGGYQLSIGDGVGGFRITGPRHCGRSKRIQRHQVSERDASQIRGYLDRAFPPPEDTRDATIQALAAEVERLAGLFEFYANQAVQEDTDRALFEHAGTKARALLSRLGVRP